MPKIEQLILPLVLITVLVIKSGKAIQCYNCDSSVDPECSEIKKTMSLKSEHCKPSVIGQNVGDWLKDLTRIDFYETADVSVPMVCQKILARNKDNKVVTFRGCQLDGGKTDVCETVKTKALKDSIAIEACEVCSEDDCNAASCLRNNTMLLFLITLCLIKSFF